MNTLPVVECWSSLSAAQSASLYPITFKFPVFLYCIHALIIPFKYLMIRFAAVRCASVGAELNVQSAPTACEISGLVAIAA